VVVDARRRSRRVYTHFPRAQAASVAAATAVILSTTAPAFASVNIELMDKRQENQTGLQLIYEVGRGHLTIHDSTIVTVTRSESPYPIPPPYPYPEGDSMSVHDS
jgi:hypothetical protein|tara:strand:- start:811 stop:1125 length:315 start_codon:yes stop_codon:yes gene_type:complete